LQEPAAKEKHPVGVGLNWSQVLQMRLHLPCVKLSHLAQVLEERSKPKASYFDSDRNVVAPAKTLSPSMVSSCRFPHI
jgi:hypothetical protein